MNDTTQHRGSLGFLALSVLIIGLDQLSKFAIERGLAMYQSVTVLPVLEITRLHNTGAAFSFLADAAGWQRWLFTALALIVSVVLGLWLSRIERGSHVLASAVALILGGALGNVIDRLRLGHVIDFIYAHWGQHYFPAFNVADSAICVGAGLLLLDTWLTGRAAARPARK
jgi:signal peptidase II